MATEILGFLIIVGILIVFIVRRDLWNGTSSKADEVEEASVKMRLQMEHSANAIITQMDSRIHQLEGLVNAADERARTLEQQLAAVRADQERAQRKAEQEFAAMRAARDSYYAPPMEPEPDYQETARRQAWRTQEEYRARMASAGRSLRPVDGVSAVRRSDYAARIQQERRAAGASFADTLSASMYAAEAGYGNAYRAAQPPRRDYDAQPAYPQDMRYPQDAGYAQESEYTHRAGYANGDRHGVQERNESYEPVSYPVDAFPEEETWEQYPEQPRRYVASQGRVRAAQRMQTVPVEMVVEETPAVIVDSQITPRRDVYEQEEPEEEGPAFSPEQLEELARTEAEVVVSSSVADVVDLPMHPDDEEDASYDEETEDEDAHAFVDITEESEEETSAMPAESEDEDMEDVSYSASEQETEEAQDDFSSDTSLQQQSTDGQEAYADETVSETEPDDAQSTPEQEHIEEEFSEALESGEDDFPAEAADEAETATLPFVSDEPMTESVSDLPDEDDSDVYGEAADEAEELDGDAENGDVEVAANENGEDEFSPRPPSPAIHARELLEQGMAPADVARETGMGRSAVELLAQMAQGKGNQQNGD